MTNDRRIVDLSMVIEEEMQTFSSPWHPIVEITQLGRHGIENRETRKLVLGTHTGTHIDAPRHFIRDGRTVEQIPLDALVGPATVVDLSKEAPASAIDARRLERAIGDRPRDRLLVRFDGDLRLGTGAYYTDHPYFTEDACEWLVGQRCRLLALDTPQPDDPRNGRGAAKDAPNHKILLGAGVVLAEYLVNIRELRRPVVELVIAPLKIRAGDGAPARAFAIEE